MLQRFSFDTRTYVRLLECCSEALGDFDIERREAADLTDSSREMMWNSLLEDPCTGLIVHNGRNRDGGKIVDACDDWDFGDYLA
jgi:hypothetical protein